MIRCQSVIHLRPQHPTGTRTTGLDSAERQELHVHLFSCLSLKDDVELHRAAFFNLFCSTSKEKLISLIALIEVQEVQFL